MKKLLLFILPVLLFAACSGNHPADAPKSIELKVSSVKDTLGTYGKQISFNCSVKNVSGADLKFYKGILTVNETTNSQPAIFTLMNAEGIKSGETKNTTFLFLYHTADTEIGRILSSPMDKLKFDWQPHKMTYMNGRDTSFK